MKPSPAGENTPQGIDIHLSNLRQFNTPQIRFPPSAPKADLEAPNTKPLFQILAKNKKKLDTGHFERTRLHRPARRLPQSNVPETTSRNNTIRHQNRLHWPTLNESKNRQLVIGLSRPRQHNEGNRGGALTQTPSESRPATDEVLLLTNRPNPKRKEGRQTGWPRIFHLSSPKGNSVNDHIPKEYGTLAYGTFRDAVKSVAKSGKGSILLKRDLKSAFRKIPCATSTNGYSFLNGHDTTTKSCSSRSDCTQRHSSSTYLEKLSNGSCNANTHTQ